MYMYTYIYMHTHTYMYVCVCMYECVCVCVCVRRPSLLIGISHIVMNETCRISMDHDHVSSNTTSASANVCTYFVWMWVRQIMSIRTYVRMCVCSSSTTSASVLTTFLSPIHICRYISFWNVCRKRVYEMRVSTAAIFSTRTSHTRTHTHTHIYIYRYISSWNASKYCCHLFYTHFAHTNTHTHTHTHI